MEKVRVAIVFMLLAVGFLCEAETCNQRKNQNNLNVNVGKCDDCNCGNPLPPRSTPPEYPQLIYLASPAPTPLPDTSDYSSRCSHCSGCNRCLYSDDQPTLKRRPLKRRPLVFFSLAPSSIHIEQKSSYTDFAEAQGCKECNKCLRKCELPERPSSTYLVTLSPCSSRGQSCDNLLTLKCDGHLDPCATQDPCRNRCCSDNQKCFAKFVNPFTVKATCGDPCSTAKCKSGYTCVAVTGSCGTIYCRPAPKCIPNVCEGVECPEKSRCIPTRYQNSTKTVPICGNPCINYNPCKKDEACNPEYACYGDVCKAQPVCSDPCDPDPCINEGKYCKIEHVQCFAPPCNPLAVCVDDPCDALQCEAKNQKCIKIYPNCKLPREPTCRVTARCVAQ